METEQKSAEYESVLLDLEAKRDELDKAIAIIRAMMGSAPTQTTGGKAHHSSQQLTPTSFFGLSVGDAARKYLSIVKEPKSSPDIAKALQAHGVKTMSKNFTVTVFSALERRERETGDFVRPKRGLWGLKEWYPGARIKKDNGDQKDSPPLDNPSQSKSPAQTKEAHRAAVGIAANTGVITVGLFEAFIREKARRVKDVATHFGVTEQVVNKLIEPASKVFVGIIDR